MNLKIKGISSSQISIIADRIKPIPERAKYLRPVYNSASDNTRWGCEDSDCYCLNFASEIKVLAVQSQPSDHPTT